jgi:UDP-glucose 4-epimerase
MNVAITGGAGFIGSNIYGELVKHHNVLVIDNFCTGFKANLPSNANILHKDINDLTPADLDSYEVVFHCAALARVQPSIQQPLLYHKNNVDGTINLLECCRLAGVSKVIYSSSSSVYGDTNNLPTPETESTKPLSPYALQKLIGEEYCRLYSQLYGLETVCLRYFNVYGENMPLKGAYRTIIGIFQNLKKQDKPLTITNDGTQRRDFTYVKDVVKANILAMTNPNVGNGEIFNIGNGNNYSVNEIAAAFGGSVEFIGNVVEPKITLADNSKAKKFLGWKTTQDVLEWIIRNAI